MTPRALLLLLSSAASGRSFQHAAFAPPSGLFPRSTALSPPVRDVRPAPLAAAPGGGADDGVSPPPFDGRYQSFATGMSTNPSLPAAIEEAVGSALSSLPPASDLQYEVDLAVVHASSLYEDPGAVVQSVIRNVESSSGLYGYAGVRHVVGGTAGGVIGSRCGAASPEEGEAARECTPVEAEAAPAVSVTLALLPGVELRTFYVTKDRLPEYDGDMTRSPDAAERWKKDVGLGGYGTEGEDDEPIFMLLPSPAFQTSLDDLLRGLNFAFPSSQTFGGVASTVSSLSRARIFAYTSPRDAADGGGGVITASTTPEGSSHGDGCVGVAMSGDVRADTMIAQGAKPVGGVYRVVSRGAAVPGKSGDENEAAKSTIGAIVLDEGATIEQAEEEEKLDNDGEEEEEIDEDDREAKRARLLDEYAKARIPKPPLAEANFVMKTLSDDDQAFMRRALLIGLERGGSVGRSPSELNRLARGEGHRFTVRQVASAGMKDGSVTFPLGSVDVRVGSRCRFFVRDGDFARREVEALWTGFKRKELEGSLFGNGSGGDEPGAGRPTGCIVLPTLDRGAKLFGGKAGFESGLVSEYLPDVPSVSGFFSNGVVGNLDGTVSAGNANLPGSNENTLWGSSSQYVVFRSKSNRPVFSPRRAREEAAGAASAQVRDAAMDSKLAAEDAKRIQLTKSFGDTLAGEAAPRAPNGELIVRRREIHSGRAMSVSTVEWSVAEKTAKPTSALEGYMWEKETQVDRLRERIPLALLMSNTKAAMMDPTRPRPRDWIGSVRRSLAESEGGFVVIPECKRMEPASGSLRRRYDLPGLVRHITASGAPAMSVNSDGVMFGGTMEDITSAREASAAAAASLDAEGGGGDGVATPPILASDLLLYPYQLYKLRLAGADAVSLVVGAVEQKDLLYLTKIASTVGLQVVASVTTEVQVGMLNLLSPGSVAAVVVSNRDLETYEFDTTGDQALRLLGSDELAAFRERNPDALVLAEGRVGIIERTDEDGGGVSYAGQLREGGASGAIVGGALATVKDEDVAEMLTAAL